MRSKSSKKLSITATIADLQITVSQFLFVTTRLMNNVEQMANLENVENIAIGFVKKMKCVDNVNVTVVEEKDGMWVVRGTCPIDLGGHPWRESFVIRIDRRGKIQSSNFKLM